MRKRWIILALLAGLAASIAVLPLSWVVSLFVPDELSDLKFHGTIWNGSATNIPVFETANVKLSPVSLSAHIESGNGVNYLAGLVSTNHARDIDLVVDLSTLPLTDQRVKGLAGTVRLNLSEINFDAQSCLSAEGTAMTDVLQRNQARLNWTGPELSGPISCEDGSLIANISGQDQQQTIKALMRFSPNGTYRVDLSAQTSRSEAGAILPLFGFTRSGTEYKLTEQGKWR